MSNLNRYQKYLTLDGVAKAFERAGVAMSDGVQLRDPSDIGRSRLVDIMSGTAEIDQGDSLAEYHWVYGNADVQVGTVIEFDYSDTEEDRQKKREAALFALQAELKNSVVARINGEAYIVGRMGTGTFVIECGRALCKQVVVGTRKVKRPADPEAAAKIMEAIEQIEVEEPIMQWQCNDAELMAGAL